MIRNSKQALIMVDQKHIIRDKSLDCENSPKHSLD